MVYMIFNEGNTHVGLRSPARKHTKKINYRRLELQRETCLAKLVLHVAAALLFIYDFVTYPIYYVIQSFTSRAGAGFRSDQVDVQTWINLPLEQVRKVKFRGSTVGHIFASSIAEFRNNQCLGYRAVITCPVLAQNEEGVTVLQEKSFRSDYTWYTFEQIGRRVQDIASGLYHHSVYPGSRCFFFANSSLEWFCASQACFQIGAQLVLAPEISQVADLSQIIRESEVTLIFTSCDRIPQVCRLLESIKSESNSAYKGSLSKIILIDWLFTVDYTEPIFAELRDSSNGVVSDILSLGRIEETGVEHPIEMMCTRSLNRDQSPDIDDKPEYRPATSVIERNGHHTHLTKRKSIHTLPTSRKNNTGPQQPVKSGLLRRQKTCANICSSSGRMANGSLISDQFVQQVDTNSSSPKISISEIDLNYNLVPLLEESKPNDLAMLVYTRKSLGQLRAVMLTHSYLARSNHYLDGKLNDQSSVHCATFDLDNIAEFMTEMAVFSHGGCIGYSCNQKTLFFDGKDLFERDKSDLEALNPTFLLLRPYQIERLRSSVQNYLSLQYNPILNFLLLNIVCNYKKYWTRRHMDTPVTDRVFCAPLKKLFGARLQYILCIGVTDCSETKDFFAFIVNIPVIELYGLPEADICGISALDDWNSSRGTLKLSMASKLITEQEPEEPEDYLDMCLLPPKVNKNTFRVNCSKNLLMTTSIFRPAFGTRIRLEDWEDFRYTDRPYPRGRLIVGGETVCKGYYKANALDQARFYQDSNGVVWYRSDDIARIFPNGSFEIVSAMSDIIKLVDGQLISLSQIEHHLRNSQFVDNVCAVCGDDRRFVIVLVVPNLRRLALKSPNDANLKMAIGSEPEPDELADVEFRREVCNDRLLCEFVNKHLTELMIKAGFQTVESRFHLVPEIWMPESELVTPYFEPRRNAIQNYYASDIKSIMGMQFISSRKRLTAKSIKGLRKSPAPLGNNPSNLRLVSRLSY